MLKIMIIGCPGAGKSTFAKSLRQIVHLPLYHLDLLWHKSDRTTVSREEFDKALSEIVETDRWIIDGNYQRTLELRIKKCDTVFLLDFPTDVCIKSVQSRIGKKRDDMPWTETEFDEEFKSWIVDFPNRQLPKIYELIEKYKDSKNIIVFKNRSDADNYLETLQALAKTS